MPARSQPSASDSKQDNLRRANWILVGCVVIALVFILFGLLQNRRLWLEKKQLQLQLQRLADCGSCDSPRRGDIVPPFEADTSEGKRVAIGYAGTSRYLLFFLSFKCSECVKQLSSWNEIAKKAKAKNIVVLGLLTDKEDISMNAPDRSFNILTAHDGALLRAYRINVTPTVMLVSEHGRTQWVHVGPLSEAGTQELLSIINGDTVTQ